MLDTITKSLSFLAELKHSKRVLTRKEKGQLSARARKQDPLHS